MNYQNSGLVADSAVAGFAWRAVASFRVFAVGSYWRWIRNSNLAVVAAAAAAESAGVVAVASIAMHSQKSLAIPSSADLAAACLQNRLAFLKIPRQDFLEVVLAAFEDLQAVAAASSAVVSCFHYFDHPRSDPSFVPVQPCLHSSFRLGPTVVAAAAEAIVVALGDHRNSTSYFPWTIYSAACSAVVVEEASACFA